MKRFAPYLLIMVAACTFTTNFPLTPDFRVGIDTVASYLDNLSPAQHFNFDGVKKTVNGTATRTLEITVTNGKNVPTEDRALSALAKTMAVYVKSQLKDSTEYDIYDVRFDSQKKSDGVTSNSFNTIEFKTSEL